MPGCCTAGGWSHLMMHWWALLLLL
jgi:hypothetical protein